MEYTTNLNLKKPDVNEYYNVEQNNENMDLIDEAVGELNKNISGLIGYYNTNDIAVLLSTCTEKVVFFQLSGSSYVGEKPEGNFIYGTGYAIKRDNHYIGEVGYEIKHSFIYRDNTLTFLS